VADDLSGLLDDEEETESVVAPGSPDDKRVSDLMSKWQKAEARAKKAEATLASAGGTTVSNHDPDPWLVAARDSVIDSVYEKDPRFARYGIGRDFFITADPSVTKGAAAELSALLDGIEARAREDAAQGVGYVPELGSGGGTRAPIDFENMKSEDFEALVAKVKSGR